MKLFFFLILLILLAACQQGPSTKARDKVQQAQPPKPALPEPTRLSTAGQDSLTDYMVAGHAARAEQHPLYSHYVYQCGMAYLRCQTEQSLEGAEKLSIAEREALVHTYIESVTSCARPALDSLGKHMQADHFMSTHINLVETMGMFYLMEARKKVAAQKKP